MDILYTSFLQRLVQASNAQTSNSQSKEKRQLDLLLHLLKIVHVQEKMAEAFTRQNIAVNQRK